LRGLLILAMKHKAIAIVAVAAMSVGSAAAFASQDSVLLGTDDGTASQVVGEEATSTPEAVDEATPTATPVVDEATPTPEPTQVVEPTSTPEVDDGEVDNVDDGDVDDCDEGDVGDVTPTPDDGDVDDDECGPRDVVGIPDDNPSKQPEDGDGVCEKGETVIKTTPSGKQVNVPCQAVKEHGNKAGHLEDEEEETE